MACKSSFRLQGFSSRIQGLAFRAPSLGFWTSVPKVSTFSLARSIHGQRLKKGTRILAHTHESACRGSHSLQGSPFPPPWDSNVFYRTSAKGRPRDLYTVQLQLCYVSVPYGALPAQLIIPELPLVLVPQSSSAFGCLSSTLPGSTSALPWTLPALVALAHRHVGSLELPQMSLDRTVMERIPQDLRLGDTFLQQQLLQQAPNLRNEGFEQGGGGPKWYQALGLGILNSGLFLSLSHGLKSFSGILTKSCWPALNALSPKMSRQRKNQKLIMVVSIMFSLSLQEYPQIYTLL